MGKMIFLTLAGSVTTRETIGRLTRQPVVHVDLVHPGRDVLTHRSWHEPGVLGVDADARSASPEGDHVDKSVRKDMTCSSLGRSKPSM
jgi:hypothetical protein